MHTAPLSPNLLPDAAAVGARCSMDDELSQFLHAGHKVDEETHRQVMLGFLRQPLNSPREIMRICVADDSDDFVKDASVKEGEVIGLVVFVRKTKKGGEIDTATWGEDTWAKSRCCFYFP